jgi:hypothetical protein
MKTWTMLFLIVIAFAAMPVAAPCQKPFYYEGKFQSGYRDTKISFNLSPDGKQLGELTFEGNMKCDSAIHPIKITTTKPLVLTNGKVDATVSEPEDGGAASWHFEIHGFVLKGKATGTFRLHNQNLGCDTQKINWGAALIEQPR